MSVFTVKKENNDAALKWTTVGETKNDHFDIERNIDGINFTKVGTVAGNGTTNLPKLRIQRSADQCFREGSVLSPAHCGPRRKSTFSQVLALRIDGSVVVNNMTVYRTFHQSYQIAIV